MLRLLFSAAALIFLVRWLQALYCLRWAHDCRCFDNHWHIDHASALYFPLGMRRRAWSRRFDIS